MASPFRAGAQFSIFIIPQFASYVKRFCKTVAKTAPKSDKKITNNSKNFA
jgi:hypothetical protein